MIRVGNSSISPEVAPQGAAGSVSAQPKSAAGTQISDQVELSHSAAAIPEDRADRIAALKTAVASPDYLPESLPIVRKLVSGALSRSD